MIPVLKLVKQCKDIIESLILLEKCSMLKKCANQFSREPTN